MEIPIVELVYGDIQRIGGYRMGTSWKFHVGLMRREKSWHENKNNIILEDDRISVSITDTEPYYRHRAYLSNLDHRSYVPQISHQ